MYIGTVRVAIEVSNFEYFGGLGSHFSGVPKALTYHSPAR